MKPTPTQLRAVIALLSQPHDSVEDLANTVWDTIQNLQNGRDRFVTVAWHPAMNVLMVVGPYATDLQARRDAPRRVVNSGHTAVRVARLYDPDRIDPQTSIVT